MISADIPSKRLAIWLGMVLTVLLFVLCLFIPKSIALITHHPLAVSPQFLITRIAFWIALGIVFWYALKIKQQKILLWPEKSYGIGHYVVNIFLTLLVVFAGSIIIQLALRYSGFVNNSSKLEMMFKMGVPLKLFTVVTAAVVEEIVFRGYLQSRLQLYFRQAYWPIIISALIFGLAHISYGTLSNVLGPIFIGIVFAWHYQKYRSIKMLIACHFIIDFVALIIQR